MTTSTTTTAATTATYRTHAGTGHADDFYAACLVMAAGHEVIRSNSPVPGAIDFDVGGGPLDHHQNQPGGPCALDLVARHLGVTLIGDWHVAVRRIDCGTPDERNPLMPRAWGEDHMRRWFLNQWTTFESTEEAARQDRAARQWAHTHTGDYNVPPDQALVNIMTDIGKNIMAASRQAQEGLATVMARPTIPVEVSSAAGWPSDEDGNPTSGATTEQALDLRGLTMAQTATVPIDRWRIATGREPGTWSLLAPEGTIITALEGATFLHAAGFMGVVPEGTTLRATVLP